MGHLNLQPVRTSHNAMVRYRRVVVGRLKFVAVGAVMVSASVLLGVLAAMAPLVALALAGVWLVGLTIVRWPSVTVSAAIVLSCAARPAGFPVEIRGIYISEISLAAAFVATLLMWRPPRSALLIFNGYVTTLLISMVVGRFNGFPMSKILSDLRFPLAMALAFVVAAGMAEHGRLSNCIPVVRAVLWWSASLLVAAAVGWVRLEGRSENASLDLAQSVGAVRLLTESTRLAIAVVAACAVAAVCFGWATRSTLVLFVPSVVVVLLSFSRNHILIVVAAVCVGLALKRTVRPVLRLIVALAVSMFLLLPVVGKGGILEGTGVGNYLNAYAGRVVDGILYAGAKNDESLSYRLTEIPPLKQAFAISPLLGGGLGLAYKEPEGVPGSYTATSGRYFAHHLYLWILAKQGLIGLAGFILFIGLPLRRIGYSATTVCLGGVLVGMLVVGFWVPIPIGQGSDVMGAIVGVLAVAKPGKLQSRTQVRDHLGYGALSVPGIGP